MITILGAGGNISNVLANTIISNNETLRLVSRNPKPISGAEIFSADITNYKETYDAIKGSSIVYLCPGLKYDIKTWRACWPPIMRNTIEACKQHHAKLVFFDNIYMLGKVNGKMTEDTPFNPCSKKGEVRAEIASLLLNEMKAGNIQALIARSADFYGPSITNGIFNMMVIDRMVKGKKPQFMVNIKNLHSHTYVPDCGKALYILGKTESAYQQTWHLPTAPAIAVNDMIEIAARLLHTEAKCKLMTKGFIKMGGLFNKTIREVYEMLYQNEYNYIFDSSKIEKAFNLKPTSYEEGIKQCLIAAGAQL